MDFLPDPPTQQRQDSYWGAFVEEGPAEPMFALPPSPVPHVQPEYMDPYNRGVIYCFVNDNIPEPEQKADDPAWDDFGSFFAPQQPVAQEHITRPTLYPNAGERQRRSIVPYSSGDSSQLRSVSDLPSQFQPVFSFPFFNKVQTHCFPKIYESDNNMVISAPTGSGKTVILELAVLRLLHNSNISGRPRGQAIYIAPLRALVHERFEEWKTKFEPLGMKLVEYTGDVMETSISQVEKADILMWVAPLLPLIFHSTTPEKFDSMTRRTRSSLKSFARRVSLVMIDEVHILNENRGAAVEAIVSRLKTINLDRPENEALRFVAISATIPNMEDIAQWMNCPKDSIMQFGPEYRPVPLQIHVNAFQKKQNDFMFEKSLNYKLPAIISQHSNGKPSIVFCSTRKSCSTTCSYLAGESSYVYTPHQRRQLNLAIQKVKERSLATVMEKGIAYHHAGLEHSDRRLVEQLFIDEVVQVVVCTSTLALGVNLPAHLAVVKGTKKYGSTGFEEMSVLEVLQMIGRAGRPQFDTSGVAVILTEYAMEGRYNRMAEGGIFIESTMGKSLIEHLNAEIVSGTIMDVAMSLDWLKSTYMYIRVKKNPMHYGFSKAVTEQELRDNIMSRVTQLADSGLITVDKDGNLFGTDIGRTVAKYYVAFETFVTMNSVTKGNGDMLHIMEILAESNEFMDIALRTDEKKLLFDVNKKSRYPLVDAKGKHLRVKTHQQKVTLLIQATLADPEDGIDLDKAFNLRGDIIRIAQASPRILRCMTDLYHNKGLYSATMNAIMLAKCLKGKMWSNSKYVARQLSGIGQAMSSALVQRGIISWDKLSSADPRAIEAACGRQAPFGSDLKTAAARQPRLEANITDKHDAHMIEATIHIRDRNAADEQGSTSRRNFNDFCLLVGNEDDELMQFRWIKSRDLGLEGLTTTIRTRPNTQRIDVAVVHLETVGLDMITSRVWGTPQPPPPQPKPKKARAKRKTESKPKQQQGPQYQPRSYLQPPQQAVYQEVGPQTQTQYGQSQPQTQYGQSQPQTQYGQTQAQYGQTQTQTQSQYGQTQPQTQSQYGQTQPQTQYGQTQSQYGQTQPQAQYGQTQPQYGQTQPYGMAQSYQGQSYGQPQPHSHGQVQHAQSHVQPQYGQSYHENGKPAQVDGELAGRQPVAFGRAAPSNRIEALVPVPGRAAPRNKSAMPPSAKRMAPSSVRVQAPVSRGALWPSTIPQPGFGTVPIPLKPQESAPEKPVETAQSPPAKRARVEQETNGASSYFQSLFF